MNGKWCLLSITLAWIYGMLYGHFVVRVADKMTHGDLLVHCLFAGLVLGILTILAYTKSRRK